MRITVRRVGGTRAPFVLGKEMMFRIGRVVEGSILDNVKSQTTADGGAIKRNAPSTRERKRKLGLPQLSLIFKNRRFGKGKQQTFSITATATRVAVRPHAEHMRLVGWLHEMGYTGWIGISAKGSAAIRLLLRQWIVRRFSRKAA